MPLAQPERQLHELAVAGVLEDHLADVGLLHYLRNLVSRNKSGKQHPDIAEERRQRPRDDQDDAHTQ